MDGKELKEKVDALIIEHKTREDGGNHIEKVSNLLRGIAAVMVEDEEFMSALNGHERFSCMTLKDRAPKP